MPFYLSDGCNSSGFFQSYQQPPETFHKKELSAELYWKDFDHDGTLCFFCLSTINNTSTDHYLTTDLHQPIIIGNEQAKIDIFKTAYLSVADGFKTTIDIPKHKSLSR